MKLYKWLLWYWAAMVAVTVLGLFDQIALMALSLAASVAQLYALYKLRPFHVRIHKSFTYTVISLVAMGLTLMLAVLGVTQVTASGFLVLLILAVLVAAAVFALLSSYHFYWALDELRETNSYAYPDGRIRWCFYLAIVNALVSFVVQRMTFSALAFLLVSLAFDIGILVLLWIYLKAVRIREEQEDFPPPDGMGPQ